MKRRSISTKLFLVTSLFFIVLLTSMMVLHTTFFESYYQWKKTSALRSNLENLRNQYMLSKKVYASFQKDLTISLNKFEKINAASVIVINRKSDGTFQMKPIVNNETKNNVVSIDKNGNIVMLPDKLTDQFQGGSNFNFKQVMSLIVEWQKSPDVYDKLMNLGTTASFVGDKKSSLAGSIYAVTPFSYAPDDQTLLVAVTSLQPVGEAAGIVKDFYVYSYIFAILLIILLTFIFSRMISKPLLRLNDTASQMAKLDFTVHHTQTSDDEIGNLGKTLNFLSQNLKNTLHQLNEANLQLKEDMEKDKLLEKMRREFVAGVSHELKTPISLIYGYAEGLRDGIPEGKRKEEYLDVILQETEHMNKLVSDMLDLSQLESGKFTWIPAPFEIGSLIRSTVDKLSVRLDEQEIVCRTIMPDKPVEVVGDRIRVEQVLKNLLSNAIRHTSLKGHIEISLSNEDANHSMGVSHSMDWLDANHSNGHVIVSIFNQGERIPEDALDHIWDTFYKVESSRNRELGGTGIGLSIVKSILSLHGSQFGASNVEGGVLFYFTLPVSGVY